MFVKVAVEAVRRQTLNPNPATLDLALKKLRIIDLRVSPSDELVRVREVESINPATGVLQRRMVEVEGELERRVGSDEKPSPAMIAFLNDRSRHTPPEARCETQAASLP